MAIKSIKLEVGTVFQKESGGTYYYRYQVNGKRQVLSLKTKNANQAIDAAKKMIPIIKGTTADIIAAHVQNARGMLQEEKNLPLCAAWAIYEKSPERATPATVSEALAYQSTFHEFVDWTGKPSSNLRDISVSTAENFSRHMKTLKISVSTHNRKIKRIRKVFHVLREYWDGANPFQTATLLRKEREEHEQDIHRLAFSREQEQQLREVLDDDRYKVMHKPEIRVIYYLGMFTGQRMKDCVLLRWNKIDFDRRRIWVKQFKTGKEVTIPLAPQLKSALEGALAWRGDHSDYVCPNVALRYNQVNSVGKNVGNNLVNIDVLRVIRWIGLEPSIKSPGREKRVTVYGFHSLRHSFASYCAAAGVPPATVQSILGADSDIIRKYYTHVGDEEQQRAIAAVFGQTDGKSPQQRINEALEIIRNAPQPGEVLESIRAVLED